MNKSIDFDGLDGILSDGSQRPFVSPPTTPPPVEGLHDSMPPPWMSPPRTPVTADETQPRAPAPKQPMQTPGGPRLLVATLVAAGVGVVVGAIIVIDRAMSDDTDEQIEAIASVNDVVPPPPVPASPPMPRSTEAAPAEVAEVEPAPGNTKPRVLFPASFGFNSTEPTMWPTKGLARLAAELQECAGTIVVTGHTCTLGPEDANVATGLYRAAAARDQLVRAGIDTARIEVASAGSKEPVASNATLKGRRANRRVTVTCAASQ